MTAIRIVGLAPSGREAGGHEGPCWGLPWDPFAPRYTALFEMHDRELFERRGPEYVQSLRDATVPIYMHEAHHDIPMSTPYPFRRVISTVGGYFNSSIAYMLALAITENRNIEIYGVDNNAGEEWEKERPCNEYLIGQAVGRGLSVWIHPDSALLKPQLDVLYLDERQSYPRRYGTYSDT